MHPWKQGVVSSITRFLRIGSSVGNVRNGDRTRDAKSKVSERTHLGFLRISSASHELARGQCKKRHSHQTIQQGGVGRRTFDSYILVVPGTRLGLATFDASLVKSPLLPCVLARDEHSGVGGATPRQMAQHFPRSTPCQISPSEISWNVAGTEWMTFRRRGNCASRWTLRSMVDAGRDRRTTDTGRRTWRRAARPRRTPRRR